MNKIFNDQWIMLKGSSKKEDVICARKVSSIDGINFAFSFKLNKRYLYSISIGNTVFSYVINISGQTLFIADFNVKSFDELLITLDLNNCLFNSCQLPDNV